MNKKEIFSLFIACFLGLESIPFPQHPPARDASALQKLLPEVSGFQRVQDPQVFVPETLFEYIDGAAEIYLAYDFNQLIVGEYRKTDSPSTLTVEIYDMGVPKNAFGIYSAERYPESKFLSLGTQGYIEEGALNFLVGRYYVKLLCFDCGSRSDHILQTIAAKVIDRMEDRRGFPDILEVFPEKDRMPYSEKFILQNVLGYRFLHDGYFASYRVDGQEFDAFVIEGKNAPDAAQMLEDFLEAKSGAEIREVPEGYRVLDPYYHTIFVKRVDRYLCGVMKIEPAFEEEGKSCLQRMVQRLRAKL
ncbi:MAG: DUF6599 family protein [Candidatus Aminicenantales bacterium]